MALKKLSQFELFNNSFFDALDLGTVGKSEWKNFDSGEHMGTKVELVIVGDRNAYKTTNGEVVNNMYEKITVKIAKDIDVPMNAHVHLVNPQASIYGQYRNQLSIVADDIEVIKK